MIQSEFEVEYMVKSRYEQRSELPVEFRGIPLLLPQKGSALGSRLLLFLADRMIRIGQSIKNSQVRITEQKFYS